MQTREGLGWAFRADCAVSAASARSNRSATAWARPSCFLSLMTLDNQLQDSASQLQACEHMSRTQTCTAGPLRLEAYSDKDDEESQSEEEDIDLAQDQAFAEREGLPFS